VPASAKVLQNWQRKKIIMLCVGCHCPQVKVTDLKVTYRASTSNDSASQTIDVTSKKEDSDSLSPKRKKIRPIADKTLGCDVCPYRTNKLGLLTIHKTYHRPQAKNTYKCPHCPYYVCAPRLLHQHIRIHVSAAIQSPPNGDARSGFKDQASKRVLTPGDAAGGFRCTICPYVGRSKNDIIYHRQFHRSRPTAPYRCPSCPFWVGEKRMLAHHEKVHRTEEIQSSTKDVDVRRERDQQGGGDKNDLLTSCAVRDGGHQASGNERPIDVQRASSDSRRRRVARTLWRCDRCPYVTAKRSQHQTHRQLHGSCQRHTCRLCDYSVGGLHLLMQHVRLHHRGDAQTDARQPEDPPENGPTSCLSSSLKEVRPLFRCDRCPYANSRRDHLLCHSRLHASDGPLRCPQCDYSVSKVHLLTQHLRVHQLSAADALQNSSKTDVRATKDQFMRSLKLTTT